MVTLTKLFYKPAEAAELLSRGRTKIYEALVSGELRSIKVGKSRLIPADALTEYAARLVELSTREVAPGTRGRAAPDAGAE